MQTHKKRAVSIRAELNLQCRFVLVCTCLSGAVDVLRLNAFFNISMSISYTGNCLIVMNDGCDQCWNRLPDIFRIISGHIWEINLGMLLGKIFLRIDCKKSPIKQNVVHIFLGFILLTIEQNTLWACLVRSLSDR